MKRKGKCKVCFLFICYSKLDAFMLFIWKFHVNDYRLARMSFFFLSELLSKLNIASGSCPRYGLNLHEISHYKRLKVHVMDNSVHMGRFLDSDGYAIKTVPRGIMSLWKICFKLYRNSYKDTALFDTEKPLFFLYFDYYCPFTIVFFHV